MQVFSLENEQAWNHEHHIKKIVGTLAGGDFSVACWEPGQISPCHCHAEATDIYFYFSGGGTMHTRRESTPMTPGGFVVHPPSQVREYENDPACTLLFRVRHGADMRWHHREPAQ